MIIIDHGTHFFIRFPAYGRFFALNLAAVKSCPGASWNPVKKLWYVPGASRGPVEALQRSCHARIILATDQASEMTGEIAPLPELAVDIPITGELRDYQRRGVARGIELKRFLNGDAMGLGKSFQSIATVIALDAFPCLVVCPATLKFNWVNEWNKFSHKKAVILSDKIRFTWHKYYEAGLADVFIVNYESLKKYFIQSMPTKLKHSRELVLYPQAELFKSVVFDEIARLKDDQAQRTKFSMRLALKTPVRIGLSGTPVVNKPKDLFPILSVLGCLKYFAGTKQEFLNRFCEGGYGASNLRELNFILNQRCYFRREKKDVAKELPEKVRQTIVCDITNRDEYDKAQSEFDRWLSEEKHKSREQISSINRAVEIQKMMALKEVSARGKLEAVAEWVAEIMDGDDKVILFCNLHEIVDELLALFPGAVTLTGRDNPIARERSILGFQTNPLTRIIICNIKAGGVGVNLTAASYVGFVEYPWHPADCWQAEDRAHRLGSLKTVFATYFLGKDTIDERCWEIITGKADINNQITGATDQMDTVMVDKTFNLFNQGV